MNTGNICNLPKFIDIRIKHKIRIFIDETISFGVLGDKGRGITEHFNIPVRIIKWFFNSKGNRFFFSTTQLHL